MSVLEVLFIVFFIVGFAAIFFILGMISASFGYSRKLRENHDWCQEQINKLDKSYIEHLKRMFGEY